MIDVIKLGGGQSDQWHTLNYKGKYAGEIRVEITFYDSRDKPQEKKVKETRPQSVSPSELSQPPAKSLGPRDVRRRPLPASPAEVAQPQPAPVSYQEPVQPLSYEEEEYEQPAIHAPTPKRSRHVSEEPQPKHEQYLVEQQSIDYYQQQSNDPYRSSHVSRQNTWNQPQAQQFNQSSYEQEQYQQFVPQSEMNHNLRHEVSQQYYDEPSTWQQSRPQSSHMHSEPNTPYEKPLYQPTPIPSHSDSQLMHYDSTTNMDYEEYSQHERSMSQPNPYEIEEEQGPPPLPPKHRDQLPRPSRNAFPPSSYLPQPLRLGNKRPSINERSPLQSLEDEYLSEQELPQPVMQNYRSQDRHSMVDVRSQPQSFNSSPGPRRSYQNLQPYVSDGDTPPRPEQQRRISYEIRNHRQQSYSEEPQHMEEFNPRRSGNHQQAHIDELPSTPSSLSRKAVGASPKKLNGVPFGPDAYDVLNPAQSPVTNDGTAYQTAEQAKESSRFKEVEKIRDLGPIIGNDGREIDPSDHLPSDTWAPEPERKTRQPEHVVHIRSKADRPSGVRGSPLVIRHANSSYSNQNSPAPATPATSSPAARSPNSFIGGKNRLQKQMPTNARALPVQPYSSPAHSSSMILATSPQDIPSIDQYPRPSSSRRPSYDNRVPSHLTRPPLSEYQVPVSKNQTPRGPYDSPTGRQKALMWNPQETDSSKSQNSYSHSSPMQSSRRQSYDNRQEVRGHRDSYDNRSDHSFENYPEQPQQPRQERHYDDPLAAELSLIDIGPSRNSYQQGSMGRSMQRRW